MKVLVHSFITGNDFENTGSALTEHDILEYQFARLLREKGFIQFGYSLKKKYELEFVNIRLEV